MKGDYKNIYQLARKVAGLTQEQACEKLHLSVRTLANYESNEITPNSDVVANMVKVYNASWLGYKHLRQSSKLGMDVLPSIDFSDIAKSVLILQKETNDVEKVRNCMIDIAVDSRVECHEKLRWQEITKEVKELAGAALSVIFSK